MNNIKVVVLFYVGILCVTAIDLRMCTRNCRQNDHYCRWTGAPGETGHYCMQKYNECNVGCVQNCKSACKKKFTVETCVEECQYRGMMMMEMNMQFDGKDCMDECMWQADQCNRRCHDSFVRNNLKSPRREYIYPEQLAEDWTVRSGLMDNPNRPEEPVFPSFPGIGSSDQSGYRHRRH